MPMEAKDIFEANSRNVREMLSERGLGLYIPPYQRPYGWDRDKVSKLFDDTLHGYAMLLESDESFTFLGTVITIHDINFTTVQPIVRPEVPAKVLTVIDGQQRLTTLLFLCVALHNFVRLSLAKLNRAQRGTSTSAEEWLDGQAKKVVDELAFTFFDQQPYGDSPRYPRMIRAFDDQWSRRAATAQYHSPIAHLIASYSATCDATPPTEFKPKAREGHIEGEQALVERYQQLARLIKAVPNGAKRPEELEDLPTIEDIARKTSLQRALLNHDFPQDVLSELRSGQARPEFKGLLQLVLLASYVLNRVALTVVRGKDENYAFTVFESLNTTGEPLTAYETFKPRVVSAETLALYERSESRVYLQEVSSYLSTFKVGEPLQAATRDLLIYFASAETGLKLSKRLTDQRRYMKEEFERYEGDKAKRIAFVQHLRDLTAFVQHAWEAANPLLPRLPVEATSDVVKLCLMFLKQINHTVTIAPLVRFYSVAVMAEAERRTQAIQDFTAALKAMTAFSTLWRASRRGTENIDEEYRDIMSGMNSVTGLPPLARSLRKELPTESPAPIVDAVRLKAELRARLAHAEHGMLTDRDRFVAEAALVPAYTNNKPVTRLMLLAAYHDAIEDEATPGLIRQGREAVAPSLTFAAISDERLLSLEHIAPQQQTTSWPDSFYQSKDIVHRIGNLVLVHADANASLSARPWAAKKVMYAALGASSKEEAERILAEAERQGIELGESTQQLIQLSAHHPHLAAIGMRAGDWDLEFAELRAKRLLELAWDRLYAWLE